MTDELKTSILAAMAPLEGWCTLEKAVAMADIILEHKPKLVVETGVFGGKSAIPIAMTLREVGGSCVLYAIDPWSVAAAVEGDVGSEHVQWWTSKVNLEDIYRGFVKSTMSLDLGWYLRWIRTKSDMASRMFHKRSIDFFHQDSNHSEQVSCKEVKLWAPLMKKKSFWVFDDADWPSTQKALGLIESFGFVKVGGDAKYRVFRRE